MSIQEARARVCREIAEVLEPNCNPDGNFTDWDEEPETCGVFLSPGRMYEAFDDSAVDPCPRDFFADAAAADDLVEIVWQRSECQGWRCDGLRPGIVEFRLGIDTKGWYIAQAPTRPIAVALAIAEWLGIDTTGCLEEA